MLPTTRAEAKRLGEKFYFTGIPCKHGHVDKRYATGACFECSRIITKKNRGKYDYKIGRKEYMRRWRAENKDKVRENHKKWCEENPEERAKQIERKNSKAEYKRAARKRASQWKKDNRAYCTHLDRLREMGKVHRTPPWADLDAIKFFYEHCPPGHHVDHIIPLNGVNISGLHVETNLQWLPAEENLRKSNKWT